MRFKFFATSLFIATSISPHWGPQSAYGAIGFGTRKSPSSPSTPAAAATAAPTPPPSSPSPSAPIARVTAVTSSTPPNTPDTEWLKVPFEKAENELLQLFSRDIPKLETHTQELALYEVRAGGQLPLDYRRKLRNKLEQVLLTSRSIQVKQCPSCEQARVYQTESGELRYESFTTDPTRPARIANEVGAAHLLYSEMTYTPEDLELRVRLVEASNGRVLWTKDYSTAEVVRTRESLNDAGPGELGQGDSLAHALIGEIAFTTVLSPGFGIFPTIKKDGKGGGLTSYGSLDLLIGEKFDRGKKVFGFSLGAIFKPSTGGPQGEGQALTWAVRLAPRFRYVFNPHHVRTARYSIGGEVGALISMGLTTAYFGLGPEVSLINRFSVSITPMYILPATINGTEVFNQTGDGGFESRGSTEGGTFGGFGALAKVSINW